MLLRRTPSSLATDFAAVLFAVGLVVGAAGLDRAAAEPAPVALDPDILALLTEVSADSLFQAVQTLQDFHTRNTASDTVSTTTGIGAARRWVHERFGAEPGVVPGYFDWEGTFCGGPVPARNVTGTVAGSEPSRLIVVGAHLDSRTEDVCDVASFQPAANDDASGVACLLELARLLPALDLEASVVLQAFTGEEQGLFGSTAYAENAIENGYDVDAMINNDTIGNVDGCPGLPDCDGGPTTDQDSVSVRAFAGAPSTGLSRQLARLAKLVGEGYVSEMEVKLQPALDRPGRGGDHIPFHEAGYPAMRFIETLEYTEQQHNAEDLIDYMEFSYFRRNVLLNLALVANLAMAPERPEPPEVFDLGTGGAIRVSWNAARSGDVAGYRVAYRNVASGDTLYYADILDAGAATTLDISGLTNDIDYAVSLSAYDSEGHESVFSEERIITPGIVPHLPPGFFVASQAGAIQIGWDTPPELDLASFKVWRSFFPDAGFTVLETVPAPSNGTLDATAVPGVDYYYRLSTVDVDENESPLTESDKGRLLELAPGILVVDATNDGTGVVGNPSDEQVDAFYDMILADAPVLATWDWVDQEAAGATLTDADMGQYQTVFIHSDRQAGPLAPALDEIRQYLDAGGQVYLGGWELKTVEGAAQLLTEYEPGSFFHDVLKIPALRTSTNDERDFNGGDPLDPNYPSLTVDTDRWPFFSGNLRFIDGVVGPLLTGAAAIEAYRSSLVPPGPNDGLIIGVKWPAVDPQIVYLGAPLYFLDETGVQALVDHVLGEFGYDAADVPDGAPSTALRFRAFPNPSSGETRLAFSLATAAEVSLRIYDVQGRTVRSLVDGGPLDPGSHVIAWDGRTDHGTRAASGRYYAVLRLAEREHRLEVGIVR